MLIPRSELVRTLSLDSQARMTTDPNRPVRLGTGDGLKTTWDTPFIEASTLKGYVDGVVVTGTTLKMGTGTDGVDQIQFPSAPATGKTVAVSADGLAVNLTNLTEAQDDAENRMEGSVLSAGYQWPVTGAALRTITPEIVREVKEILRLRRDLEVSRNASGRTPQEQWRYNLAKGDIKLPPDTPVASVTSTDSSNLLYGSEESVFNEDGYL